MLQNILPDMILNNCVIFSHLMYNSLFNFSLFGDIYGIFSHFNK